MRKAFVSLFVLAFVLSACSAPVDDSEVVIEEVAQEEVVLDDEVVVDTPVIDDEVSDVDLVIGDVEEESLDDEVDELIGSIDLDDW